jgi:hypothetical protein
VGVREWLHNAREPTILINLFIFGFRLLKKTKAEKLLLFYYFSSFFHNNSNSRKGFTEIIRKKSEFGPDKYKKRKINKYGHCGQHATVLCELYPEELVAGSLHTTQLALLYCAILGSLRPAVRHT